jgi:hypothetical protein
MLWAPRIRIRVRLSRKFYIRIRPSVQYKPILILYCTVKNDKLG